MHVFCDIFLSRICLFVFLHPLISTHTLPLLLMNILSQLSSQRPHPCQSTSMTHPPVSPHVHAHPPHPYPHTSSHIRVRFTLLLPSQVLPPPHNPPTSLPSPLRLHTPASGTHLHIHSLLSSPCPAASLPHLTSACREALPCTCLRVTGTLGPPAYHAPVPHFPWLLAPPLHTTAGYLPQSHPSSCSRVILPEAGAWATSRFRRWT